MRAITANCGPVGRGIERAQPLDLLHRELRLDVAIRRHADELHVPASDRIEALPAPARRLAGARVVDPDRMVDLHSVRRAGDHLVRGADDVLRRAVVLHEVDRLGLVVLPEAADELDARLPEA